MTRYQEQEPTSWSHDAIGFLNYHGKVVEIYWVVKEEEDRQADHVKLCDETIVPNHLQTAFLIADGPF